MLYIYISYIIYIIYILKWKSFHWKCYLEKSQNFLLWRYSLLIYFSSNTNIYIISHSGKAFTAQQKQCYGELWGISTRARWSRHGLCGNLGWSRGDLQWRTKYLTKALVLVWNSALRKKFNFYFPADFCWYWQNFHCGGRAGHWAIDQCNEALGVFWYFLISVLRRTVLCRSATRVATRIH